MSEWVGESAAVVRLRTQVDELKWRMRADRERGWGYAREDLRRMEELCGVLEVEEGRALAGAALAQ